MSLAFRFHTGLLVCALFLCLHHGRGFRLPPAQRLSSWKVSSRIRERRRKAANAFLPFQSTWRGTLGSAKFCVEETAQTKCGRTAERRPKSHDAGEHRKAVAQWAAAAASLSSLLCRPSTVFAELEKGVRPGPSFTTAQAEEPFNAVAALVVGLVVAAVAFPLLSGGGEEKEKEGDTGMQRMETGGGVGVAERERETAEVGGGLKKGVASEEKGSMTAAEIVRQKVEEREAREKAEKELQEKAAKEEEETAKKEAEAKAKKEAEEKAKKQAEENAKREAEEKAKQAAEEKAKKETEEKAKKEAEEKAKKEAEEKAKKEAEEKAKKEAEANAKKEAEEKAKKEAEEKAKKEAEEKAKKEAEEKAKKEAEEKAKKEAEEKAKKEAEEKAKKEAEEKAKKEAEEKAKKEAEEKAKKEAEEKAKKEAEEKAKKEAEEKAKKEAEEKAKREAEEKAKMDTEKIAASSSTSPSARDMEELDVFDGIELDLPPETETETEEEENASALGVPSSPDENEEAAEEDEGTGEDGEDFNSGLLQGQAPFPPEKMVNLPKVTPSQVKAMQRGRREIQWKARDIFVDEVKKEARGVFVEELQKASKKMGEEQNDAFQRKAQQRKKEREKEERTAQKIAEDRKDEAMKQRLIAKNRKRNEAMLRKMESKDIVDLVNKEVEKTREEQKGGRDKQLKGSGGKSKKSDGILSIDELADSTLAAALAEGGEGGAKEKASRSGKSKGAEPPQETEMHKEMVPLERELRRAKGRAKEEGQAGTPSRGAANKVASQAPREKASGKEKAKGKRLIRIIGSHNSIPMGSEVEVVRQSPTRLTLSNGRFVSLSKEGDNWEWVTA